MRKVLLVVIPLLLMSIVHAESQQPHSLGQPPQENINATHNKQQSDYGTKDIPFFVKIIPAPKNDVETQKEEQERNRKVFVEYATIAIAFITAVILLLQLFVFGTQAKRLKETIDEMKVATKATQEAANAATAQTAVAVKEFISTHRPRLIVRNITIMPNNYPRAPLEKIEWAVINSGDTAAEIIESNGTILEGVDSFDGRTSYSPARDTMKGIEKIAPGSEQTFQISFDPPVDLGTDKLMRLIRGETYSYFVGFIRYKDDIGNIRRTAFCRRYNVLSRRFNSADNAAQTDFDYEYTD
jgi:hypothetical protein